MIKSRLYVFFCSVFFALSILMPDIPYPIIGNLRPEDLILILLGLFVLDNIFLKNGHFPRAGWSVFVMLLMFAWIVIVSSGINYILGNVDNPGLVFKEFIRFVKYAVVFVVFLWLDPKKARIPFQIFLISAILVIGIQIMQKYQLFGVDNWLKEVYGSKFIYPTQSYYWRGGSVFSNPNLLGIFLLLPFAFIFSTFIAPGEIFYNIKLKKFTSLIFIIIFGLGILFTQSLTSVVAMFVIVFFGMFLRIFEKAVYKKRNERNKPKYIIYIILFLFCVAFISRFYNLERIFNIGDVIKTGGSLSLKLMWGQDAARVIMNSNPLCLIFGMSPGAKYIQTDFEYGYLFYWYGLSGLLFYGLLIYLQLRIFSKRLGTQNGITGMSIVLAFLFFGIGGTALINNRVYPMTLALFAMMINNLSDNLIDKNINKKLFL